MIGYWIKRLMWMLASAGLPIIEDDGERRGG